jgi:hypothetical protein
MSQKNKKIISYSLFGYGKERQENCFEFYDYLRGLMVNIRMARMVYPDWIIRLHVDKNTYKQFKDIFNNLTYSHIIEIHIHEEYELTKAMLWRLLPCFDEDVEYTICRDLDSPLTYREAQAVDYWIHSGKAAHAITDSISHNVPMLGGMIGFWKYIRDYTGARTWEELVNKNFDFKKKGTDQDLLNKFVYPGFANGNSITQHYVSGMPNTFLNDYHNQIEERTLPGVPAEYKDTNETCGHIGAAGYYTAPMNKILQKYRHLFKDLEEIEKFYSKIFYWNENI